MSDDEPNLILALVFAGWALAGILASVALLLAVPRQGNFVTELTLRVGPLLGAIAGLVFHARRSGKISAPMVAAVLGVALGALVLAVDRFWLSPFAELVGPPAFATAAFLLVAAFEKPGTPVSSSTFQLAFAISLSVLLPAALLTGGFRPLQRDYLRIALLALLVLVNVLWTGRYLLSRRSSREERPL